MAIPIAQIKSDGSHQVLDLQKDALLAQWKCTSFVGLPSPKNTCFSDTVNRCQNDLENGPILVYKPIHISNSIN
jgi:hypothetical protein